MIKLCIISTIPTTIKAFFGDQLQFLQEHGYETTVITSRADSDQDFGKAFPDGVKVQTVQMGRTIKPLEDFRALKQIIKIMRKEQFDLVQYVTPKGAMFGSIASWFTKVPVRLYLMWGLYYITQTGLKRFLFKMIEKMVCRCSTFIAPDSKGNVKLAVEEGLCTPEKIGVVAHGSANGVDTARFDPDRLAPFKEEIRNKHNIPVDAFVFGSVSAIVGDKGINELIAAFVQIAEKNSDVYLLYIGQTTEKDPVSPETLKEIETHDRIVHVGWQTEPEKYMAAMDVFVLPTYREGFGVVNIEASAMRLPVISTDVPGPQESIVHGQTGLLVPAKEVKPLAEAMKDLLGRRIMAKKMSEAGRKRVQQYYEQKKLWNAILEHRRQLLLSSGKFTEMDGRLVRK
ncbi:MAG: glycosyltransferase family 4 protein [Planctomycetota bacterium]|jgi:glycosyltransferase involved in cell wall biosynthesis